LLPTIRTAILVHLLALFFCLPTPGEEFVDGVAAVVDGEVITFLEVRREAENFRRSRPEEAAMLERDEGRIGVYRHVAKMMVDSELIAAEVRSRDLNLPRKYVDRRIQRIVNERAEGDWSKFSQMLLDAGKDMEEFRQEVWVQMASEALVDEMVRRNIVVTPSDVKKYYEKNRHQFQRPERVRITMLTLAQEEGESEQEFAARMELAAERLGQSANAGAEPDGKGGEGAAGNITELDWQNVSDLSGEFRETVHGLDVGEVGEPIRTADGAILLLLGDREEPSVLGLDERLGKTIEMVLRGQAESRRYERFVQGLRSKFYVRNFIAESRGEGQ
jgi:foldase protein PrsA